MTKINIVEIIRRSDQCVTRPFYCRADDGFHYFVKGNGAGKIGDPDALFLKKNCIAIGWPMKHHL